MHSLLRLTAALLCSIAFLPLAGAAEIAGAIPTVSFEEIDAKTLTELVAATAGDVRPDKVAKYGGNFAAYWQAASSGLGGKVFEAVVADTCNARFRALGDARRLVPTAFLGDPKNAADLHCIERSGAVARLIQAKLGANEILAALDDPKYASMDLLTCQESFDELQRQLQKEVATASRRGRPVKAIFQLLADAIDSGRLWRGLPCGAPLPERSVVDSIGQAHFESRWTKLAAAAADDLIRSAAAAERATAQATTQAARQVTTQAPRLVNGSASLGDDLARAAAGSTDDAVGTSVRLAQGAAKWAGPVATGVEVVVAGYEAQTTEMKYASGQISHEQREVAHAGTIGGVGGSWAGGAGGATGGAAVGTIVCPGVGTAVGGVVGAVGGAIGGSAAGRFVAAKGTEAIHRTGNTIASTAGWLGRSAQNAYNWATDW